MKTLKPLTNNVTVTFGECEHDGDLEPYVADLVASGARVVEAGVEGNYDEGDTIGVAKLELKDPEAFLAAFKLTDSFGFSSLRRYR